MTKGRVLLVEDEAGIRLGIRRFLESKGFEVGEAETCRGAVDSFVARPADAVLLDNLLPDGNGIDLLTRLKDIAPAVPVVVITAHGSIEAAVRWPKPMPRPTAS